MVLPPGSLRLARPVKSCQWKRPARSRSLELETETSLWWCFHEALQQEEKKVLLRCTLQKYFWCMSLSTSLFFRKLLRRSREVSGEFYENSLACWTIVLLSRGNVRARRQVQMEWLSLRRKITGYCSRLQEHDWMFNRNPWNVPQVSKEKPEDRNMW